MIAVVDASVWVSAWLVGQTGHGESDELIRTLTQRGDPLLAPNLVAAEIASALRAGGNPPASVILAVQTMLRLPGVTLIDLDPALAQRARDLAAHYPLRGADAVYAAVAQRFGAELITRDARQQAGAAAVIKAHSPDQALMLLG